MVEISQDEELKIAIGVWICFADKVVQPVETSAVYKKLKRDLLPETHEAAIGAVGEWLSKFHGNFLTTEKELETLVKSNERLPMLKHKILELAEHVSQSDGQSQVSEESAIHKLKTWLA